jgi:putative effector of murein hydrolase
MSPSQRRSLGALVADLGILVIFILVGRRTHEQAETLSGTLNALAPFVVALGIGWLSARAWRNPTDITTGIWIWVVTLVLGMVVRSQVAGQGTATAFVIVAAGFTGAGLVGWRFVWTEIHRTRTRIAARTPT